MVSVERVRMFILSVLINMLLRYEWAIITAFIFIVHFIIPAILPLWCCFVPIVLWFLHALIVTGIISALVNFIDWIDRKLDKGEDL